MKTQAEKEGTRPSRGRWCPKGGVLGSGKLTSHTRRLGVVVTVIQGLERSPLPAPSRPSHPRQLLDFP